MSRACHDVHRRILGFAVRLVVLISSFSLGAVLSSPPSRPISRCRGTPCRRLPTTMGRRNATVRIPAGNAASAVGSYVRLTGVAFDAPAHASSTWVAPSWRSSVLPRSTTRSSRRGARSGPSRSPMPESSTRSADEDGSKSWTPLPVLSSALIVKASSVPFSCQENSETLPNVVSRPVASSRTISVAPGATGPSSRRGSRSGVLALGRVSPQGDVRASRIEGEGFDAIDRRRVAGREIHQPELSLHRFLLLAQLLFLRLGVTDRIGEPAGVRREGRLRSEGGGPGRAVATLVTRSSLFRFERLMP